MEFYLFGRMDKIIHFDDLSILKNAVKIEKRAEATMSQNEVFVLQIAALSQADDIIRKIENDSADLKIECINTDFVDKFGKSGHKSVSVKKNILQPLFFTVESPHLGRRTQTAKFSFECESGTYEFEIAFNINDSRVYNNGYNDLWRLSRLKWLNSSLEQNDDLVRPFTSPEVCKNRVKILGREVELSPNGLPAQVYSYFDEAVQLCGGVQASLFEKPCELEISGEKLAGKELVIKAFKNRAELNSLCDSADYSAHVAAVIRYDGQIQYSVKINPKHDFVAKNVCLNIYVSEKCTSLMHGLGRRASKAADLSFKWDADKQQDSVFLGSVNCGMRVKYKAENYRRPLVNIFYKNLPLVVPESTWDNHSQGEITVKKENGFAEICAKTGAFQFKAGEEKSFDFEIHITPFKPFDYKKAFGVRYCHVNNFKDEYKEIDDAAKHGLNYVIFHQGNSIMPYINYPFYETQRLKKAVQYAESKGIGIKLYYTEREHSNHMAETFAYKALGDEIILRKQGVSHSWQKEKPKWLVDNFGEDIIPGWFVKYNKGKYKGEHDISFIVHPDTRLDNYYIEGLNWLLENIGIKGVYIDDTSLDRTTIERAKKLLDKKNGLIDMHMWNHEEPRAGDVSCLNLYCELLPFLDSIWLGEGFFYKKYSPEYMLAEVSGIPYGVPGQMLQDGGDLYEGMLYAMNNRYGWGCKNSVKLYKVWDDFGIEQSKMLGYWHSENPVKTTCPDVLATVYLKKDGALVCLYNFGKKKRSFGLEISQKLGFKIKSAERIYLASGIKRKCNPNGSFALSARRGMMLRFFANAGKN